MAELDTKPEAFKPGSYQIRADDLNRMRDMALRQVRGGPTIEADYFGDRILLKDPKQEASLPGVQNYLTQFVVLQEYDDYLLCTPFIPPAGYAGWSPQVYDATLGKGSIVVAFVTKPFVLQRTPWDGQTALVNGVSTTYAYTGIGQRTANGSSQQVTPSYFLGDVITAVKQISGYLDPGYNPLLWMDVNTAGRNWQGQSSISNVFARLNITGSIHIPNGVGTKIASWNVESDPTGTATANGFNFGDSSIYSYHLTVVWNQAPAGARGVAIVYNPFSSDLVASVQGPPTNSGTLTTMQSVNLNAPGDQPVSVYVYQNSGGSLDIFNGSDPLVSYTVFTATKIP